MDISNKNQQKDSRDAADSTSSAEAATARITIDDMFVGWTPPPPNDQPNEKKGPKGLPRLSHKKSKTGCQRCRARRVKASKILLLSLVIRPYHLVYQNQVRTLCCSPAVEVGVTMVVPCGWSQKPNRSSEKKPSSVGTWQSPTHEGVTIFSIFSTTLPP
jgi:hypothetical protein